MKSRPKHDIHVVNEMGFFKWLYLGIVLLRIANVIDWDWRVILAPMYILLLIAFLLAIYPGKDSNGS